jgi:DNA-binding NarL/FixJ family response regulator
MRQARLALLVPDRIIRTGIESLIKQDSIVNHEVIIFEDFELFLIEAPTLGVLLMDISGMRMPEIQSRLIEIARCCSSLQVIIINNRLTAVHVHRVMQLGAKGFIYRDVLSKALLNSIDLVLRDVVTMSTQALQLLTHTKHLTLLNEISPMDMQVLRLTARGQTVKMIAVDLKVSTRSVYRSRDKLRDVLDVPTIEMLIDAAREQGLLDSEED